MTALTLEETRLRQRLLEGRASLQEGLRLYSSMTNRGLSFPVEWEEIVLRLALQAEPGRSDLIARLRHVMVTQGKQVDPAIEESFAAHMRHEERERDHQRDAEQYETKSRRADMDPAFLPIYERCRPFTMTSVERMYALFSAVRYLEQARIGGAIVECGVWRGGSMMLVALTLASIGTVDRDLYLFDTYEGLPRPDDKKDIDIWGNRAIDGWLPRSIDGESSHWAEASIEEVTANLASTGYPLDRLRFVKGMVERTIPDEAPEEIGLLRLDTDWYASTKHELECLFPRLKVHGVLLLDDYGHFKGARQAVDEYFSSQCIPMLLNRVDYSGRIGIKIDRGLFQNRPN